MKKALLVFLSLIISVIVFGQTTKPLTTKKIIANNVLDVNKVSSEQLDNKIDREKFFKNCLKEKQFIKLTKGNAKKTIDLFFDYWEQSTYTDKRWIAYILATVFRETCGTMMPVREGLCTTNECSIKYVSELVRNRNKKNKKNGKPLMVDYGIPDEKGNSYYGRGYNQLTGKNNYKKDGEKIGVGNLLVEHPDSVLSVNISLKIVVEGSVGGWFTKNKKTKKPNQLSTFFNEKTEDWLQARDITNPGTTVAHKQITADIAKKLYRCIK